MKHITACIHLFCITLLTALPTAAEALSPAATSKPPVRIGMTPVFLDHQPTFNVEWRQYLEHHLGRPVVFVHRNNYSAIVDMLHEQKLDFAWLSGFPFIRNKDDLRLIAVPLYKGEPLYQSYLIVPSTDEHSQSLADLQDKSIAFSDPDSNSGYLYIAHLLAAKKETPSTYFSRPFFAWSRLKVIEAVASGLAQSGAVDGYVWDTLTLSHPEITAKTRILSKSPQFGNAPFVASRAASRVLSDELQSVLVQMVRDQEGRRLLKALNLDGFSYGNESLYRTIEKMSKYAVSHQQ
jgi:phosphonate transport system substrate-binding protein